MDLSKAYDCLPHDLLTAKFGANGLGKSSLRLLMNYLDSCKQQTKVDSSYSQWSEIKHRIPQGSILAPLLFTIFINDLFFSKKNLIFVLFRMIILCNLLEQL